MNPATDGDEIPGRWIAYRKIIGARVRSQLQYRTSFAIDCLTQFGAGATELATLLVLFSQLNSMGGFSLSEVALMYGLAGMAFALADLVVGHIELLPRYVRTGTFDALLLRPLGTLTQVVTSDIALRRLGRILQAGGVLVYALASNSIDWNLQRVALLLITPIAGGVIFGSIFVAACCVTFWVVEGGEFANAFTYGGSLMTSYPTNIFATWVRRLFTFVIPAAFVAYFPTLAILGHSDPLGLPVALQWCGPVAAIAAAAAAGLLWRTAVRHYKGTGS
jgi:ABC-2 type transport system permease protein